MSLSVFNYSLLSSCKRGEFQIEAFVVSGKRPVFDEDSAALDNPDLRLPAFVVADMAGRFFPIYGIPVQAAALRPLRVMISARAAASSLRRSRIVRFCSVMILSRASISRRIAAVGR